LRSAPRTIEDLGSTHGCRVRGEALRQGEPVAFELGEPLLVGRVTIVVQQRAFADEATATLESEEASDQAWLVVAVAGKAISHPLRLGRTITIGRSSTCDVVIDDPSVSRVHASLNVGTQPMLEDRGSSTGTRIGERTITSAPIAFGEAFQLGGVTLILQRRGAPAKAAAQTDGMERVRDLAARVAPGRVSVLVVGESGVGKEYLAELIHTLSPRRDGPLVKLNCGALSENLVEAELFGYEKGAFTGAVAAKAGLIEAAAGGTVFLDEIGELPPNQLTVPRAVPVQTRRESIVHALRKWDISALRKSCCHALSHSLVSGICNGSHLIWSVFVPDIGSSSRFASIPRHTASDGSRWRSRWVKSRIGRCRCGTAVASTCG
jgi:pSer/pThr/pTyr-binding forkhead associated (FHA) protein